MASRISGGDLSSSSALSAPPLSLVRDWGLCKQQLRDDVELDGKSRMLEPGVEDMPFSSTPSSWPYLPSPRVE